LRGGRKSLKVAFDRPWASVTREPALGDAVYAASAETRALRRAWKLMEPLVHGLGFAVAAAVRPFDRMVSVLEHLAYRCATRMSSLVDTIRYDILESKMNEARLAQYWMAMHAMGNTILLVVRAGAGGQPLAVGYGEAHTVGLVDAHVPSAAPNGRCGWRRAPPVRR